MNRRPTLEHAAILQPGRLRACELGSFLYKGVPIIGIEEKESYEIGKDSIERWDIHKTLERGALFNFVYGARGVGKTFVAKEYVIDDFIKNGNQFIYLRRYDAELKRIKRFFDDTIEVAHYPETKFSVGKGGEFYIGDNLAGQALALTTYRSEKSTAYPKVGTIIFDEFVIMRGRVNYLPNEVIAFLEMYSTISRDRDVKVLFLGNALTMTNPYMLYFHLNLPYGKKNYVIKNDMQVEIVKSQSYASHMNKTRFGQIIKGTPYGDYNIENEFLLDKNYFIGKKSGKARYLFTLTHQGKEMGVWIDSGQGKLYVSNDVRPNSILNYTFVIDEHRPNTMLVKNRSSPYIKLFYQCYADGLMRFESVKIKNLVEDIIRITM